MDERSHSKACQEVVELLERERRAQAARKPVAKARVKATWAPFEKTMIVRSSEIRLALERSEKHAR